MEETKTKEQEQKQEISEEQLKYIVEELSLELDKLYIDFELFKRRITRAEQELNSYKQLLLSKTKVGSDKYRKQES